MYPAELSTPCLLIDESRLLANIADMQRRMAAHGVRFRPHVKTHKCIEIAERMRCASFTGITVSTLREAEYFAEAGFRDVLYGVSIAPNRFERAAALLESGVDLILLIDDLAVAGQIAGFLESRGLLARVMIEIDVDGHRAGLEPDEPALLALGDYLAASGALDFTGLMTHAGESYGCSGAQSIAAHAELERAGIHRAAQHLRARGIVVREVSVGSTPTARHAARLDGVSEVRPGVFTFYDLVMAGIGACGVDEIALSVLTTVIGHKHSTRRLIIDAGGLALSKDRGTADQARDCGFGLVTDAAGGPPLPGLMVNRANQEHGMIDLPESLSFDDFPIGSQLRVLPNHACMTAAAHDSYFVLGDEGQITARWSRCNGW
jgi:D-serine deaminase-like pyridoxal phosphate-dependent protein